MDFGILAPSLGTDRLIEIVRCAEENGFDFAGLGDTQCLLPELHANLGALAREVPGIDLGPTVTNPVTRHPAVTASALCTVNAMLDGRAVLGVGTGDSAVFTVGERPVGLAELETFVRRCKALCAGEGIEIDGSPVRLSWLDHHEDARDVPVLVAASGPKTLELGGRVADRVLIGSGVTPEVIEAAAERIDEGAREAGRDPDEVEKWIWPTGLITDDFEAHRETVQEVVAGAGHLTFQFTLEGKQVPAEYEEPIRRLVEEYDSDAHMGLGETPHNRTLVEELGLTDYLADRFCVIGTPEECAEQLRGIDALGVVDGAHFISPSPPEEFITTMGESVLPRV